MRRHYKIVPKRLTINGKKYKLRSWHKEKDEICRGLYFMTYEPVDEADGRMPPEWNDGHKIYFLCACSRTEEECEKRMLDKLNGNW